MSTRLERRALFTLLVFTVVAVGGYWNFALHPERLPLTPTAIRFYAVSFALFARGHIILAVATLAIFLVRRVGIRWIPAALVISALAFLAEYVGTGTGFPFGDYGYMGLLGFKLLGRVPVLIPVSWFLMALPSWAVTRAWIPGRRGLRIAVGAAWLAAWDLALDPAMSHLTPYWRWDVPGAYYGMPWFNLLGWYGTGLVLVAVMDVLGHRAGLDRLPVRWLASYYVVLLLMPLGMVAAAGLGWAVFATLVGLSVCAWATWGASRLATMSVATVEEAPSSGALMPSRAP